MKKIFGKRKRGFTLAETLITLMIIGVVAVLVIPAFMNNINENALARQRDLFSKKFTEGLNQMRVDGLLNQKYERTEDFVAQMQKYFKINAVCENTNLAGCFQENFSYEGAGSDIVKDEKTGKSNLKIDESKNFTLINGMKAKDIKDSVKYDANVMGIVFADGVQMLLYVDPDCTGPEEADTQGNVTSCISYLADVNQTKSPNQIEKDIVSNISFANLDFEILEGPKGIIVSRYDFANGCSDTYWACANNYCAELGGKLPSRDQLVKLGDAMGYADPSTCTSPSNDGYGYPAYFSCDSNKIEANSLWKKLGGGSYFSIWSAEEHPSHQPFNHGYSTTYTTNSMLQPNNTSPKAMCVSR